MSFPKEATAWMAKNTRVARAFAARNPKLVGSISRYAAWGAGIGAVRGAFDEATGRGNEGILGGAIGGAVALGGLRGMAIGLRSGMNYRGRSPRFGRRPKLGTGMTGGAGI